MSSIGIYSFNFSLCVQVELKLLKLNAIHDLVSIPVLGYY